MSATVSVPMGFIICDDCGFLYAKPEQVKRRVDCPVCLDREVSRLRTSDYEKDVRIERLERTIARLRRRDRG